LEDFKRIREASRAAITSITVKACSC